MLVLDEHTECWAVNVHAGRFIAGVSRLWLARCSLAAVHTRWDMKNMRMSVEQSWWTCFPSLPDHQAWRSPSCSWLWSLWAWHTSLPSPSSTREPWTGSRASSSCCRASWRWWGWYLSGMCCVTMGYHGSNPFYRFICFSNEFLLLNKHVLNDLPLFKANF